MNAGLGVCRTQVRQTPNMKKLKNGANVVQVTFDQIMEALIKYGFVIPAKAGI